MATVKKRKLLTIGTTAHAERFTGKQLISVRKGTTTRSVHSLAKNASIRMASSSDFKARPERFESAFRDGDGIYFERLGIAVVNERMEEGIQMLTSGARSRNAIAGAEPERYVYALAKRASAVSHFTDTAQHTWGIQATDVMKSSFTGKGVRIAILDTGVDDKHPDLRGRHITTKSFINRESAMDGNGHGTHCVGVSCGHQQSSTGLRYGVASAAEIYAGKVLSNSGRGSDRGILAGIQWAMDNKCRIISMSLGSPAFEGEPYSRIYDEMAAELLTKNILLVAAAGNESDRPGMMAPVGHPANCPSIMAVGAIDSKLNVASFSCCGTAIRGGQVDVAAPGVNIFSSVPRPELYELMDGTSMATPFVAGIAALVIERYPTANAHEVWVRVVQTARRLHGASTDIGSGLAQAPR